jgi:hypothetical protein
MKGKSNVDFNVTPNLQIQELCLADVDIFASNASTHLRGRMRYDRFARPKLKKRLDTISLKPEQLANEHSALKQADESSLPR